MIVYLYAVVVLSILAACEYAYSIVRRRPTFDLRDTVSSAGTAVLSIGLKLVTRGLEVGLYVVLLEHIAVLSFDWHHPAMIALAIVLYDLCYYWRHRVSHTVNLFWAIHAVHHQSRRFNLTTSFRQYSFGFMTDWIFVVPLAMLGIPVDVFVIALFVDLLYQFWVHTLHIGRIPGIEGILVTPKAHRLHHATNDAYQNRNFGGIFVVWDRLFGTYVVEDEEPDYGILPRLNSWNPVIANIQIPCILATELRARGWKRLLPTLFGHPKDLDYSISPRFAPVSGGGHFARYALASVVLAVLFLLIALLRVSGLDMVGRCAAAAYIWYALFCGIGILDGQTYQRWLCLARPIVLAGTLMLMRGAQPMGIALLMTETGLAGALAGRLFAPGAWNRLPWKYR